jgi:AcrR family transcriptional regulator
MDPSSSRDRVPTAERPAPSDRKDKHDHVIPLAIDLFAERGYDHVTVDEIAAATGLSRRSLFRHFRQKEEFLGRWMLRFNNQLCASIVRQPAGMPPLEVFRRALDDVDEIGTSQASRLLVLNQITTRSAGAAAAMLSAERSWENAVIAAFRKRAPTASENAHLVNRMAAAMGFVALRLATVEWMALASTEATQPALSRMLDRTFTAIADISRRPDAT